jgi:hypothetical protein
MRRATWPAACSSRKDVTVGVHGDGDVGVAQALAHHLGRDAGGQRRARVAVAHIMQPNPRQPSRQHMLPEPIGEPLRMYGGPIRAGAHRVGLAIAATNRQNSPRPGERGGHAAPPPSPGPGQASGGPWPSWASTPAPGSPPESGGAAPPPGRHPGSRSLHRRPRISPRRIPVVAASSHAAYSRSPRDMLQERPKLHRSPDPHLRRLGLRRVSIGHVQSSAPAHQPHCGGPPSAARDRRH